MSAKTVILGTGIDIVEISEIKKAIERNKNRFLKDTFCPEEIAYAQKHKNSFQHFAARFAAKSAVRKALGTRSPRHWTDIKIVNQANGKPLCIINDRDFQDKIIISISHTKKYAVANALITK